MSKAKELKGDISVSFVLPMFNEEANIAKTISTLKSIAGRLTKDYEIVIVDDASTDRSAGLVRGMAAKDPSIKLFCLEKNTMFGGAFAEGFKKASKDVIVYMDSDMPVSMEDIEASFPLIREFDIVTGYSKVKKGDTLKRKFISLVYNLMIQTIFGLNVRDINSGYKIARKDLVKDIEFISKSPFVDVELFIQAKKTSGTVKQYPLIFKQREGGVSYIARPSVIMATFRDMMKLRLRLWSGK
jgi:glycosyltransferase involved in cell wall biosynthesis